jgi:hypothetical protein
MKKNSWIIFLLLLCLMGCTLQSNKQNENQEDVVEKDTAYMIEPFLRDGITYICKDEIMKPYLVDYNYSPPQKYEIDQITAKKQGNKIIVGTDCYITHKILSGTYWSIEKMGDSYSFPKTKLAILKTDKGEVRIAEVDGVLEDFCVLEVKYDNYEASTGIGAIYCELPKKKHTPIKNMKNDTLISANIFWFNDSVYFNFDTQKYDTIR